MSNESPKWMPKQRFWTDDERDRLVREHGEMAEGYREILALAEIDADDGDLALEALSSVRGIARALLAKIKKGA